MFGVHGISDTRCRAVPLLQELYPLSVNDYSSATADAFSAESIREMEVFMLTVSGELARVWWRASCDPRNPQSAQGRCRHPSYAAHLSPQ